MKRPLLLLLIVLALGAALYSVFPGCAPDSRPNILLVTLDTTRADRLGCYGCRAARTPQIDALAEEGVRFDRAWAQASLTPISHASIMTGLYPYQHGLRVLYGSSHNRLKEGEHPTLATLLQARGWNTGAFVSSFPVSEYFGLHFGFDRFNTGISGEVEDKFEISEEGQAKWGLDENQRRADKTTDQALNWLQENRDPFFLWMHFFDPHDVLLKPPGKFTRPFLKGLDKDSLEGKGDPRPGMLKLYNAEVAYMDLQLKRIVDRLKELGQYENTVILVTNDHGEGLGDHDWWAHRILYQEQLRMPLILKLANGPGDPVVEGGQVVEDLVRSIDIMPTLLEAAGLEPPRVEGKSLLGLVRGESEKERYAYADALIRLDGNRPQHCQGIYNDCLYAITTRQWKLIYRSDQQDASELYQIDIDPLETRNVIDQHPEVRDRLMERLRAPGIIVDDLGPTVIDPEAAERLNQLGYGR